MIRFGTDGWRGIIADDFTFENVRWVSQAICDYIKISFQPSAISPRPRLIVSYDTRFLSDRFALEAALVAAANDFDVLLTESFAPAPVVSFAVVDKRADGAILITASHNPPQYNGLKFKASFGGSATPEITGKIEQCYRRNSARGKKPLKISLPRKGAWGEEATQEDRLRFFDPKEAYLSNILTLLDKNLFPQLPTPNFQLKVVVDPMYGAGQGYLSEALSRLGCEVVEIHKGINPTFGGINPEPISENLEDLRREVKRRGFDVGLAMDGDADRTGAIDPSGAFIDSHQIFALLLEHLVNQRKWRGEVVKTVSTTQMIDILSRKYNLPLHVTPIGFKYICEHILTRDVLIGGEESGGIGIKNYIPERDGILIGLLLVEIMITHRKTLKELVDDLMKRIGYFYYDRVDLPARPVTKGGFAPGGPVGRHGVETASTVRENLLNYLKTFNPSELAGVKVVTIDNMDGCKFLLADESWLLIRPSGTEAVVRIYAEASSPQRVSTLLKVGQEILDEARCRS
ncbi:MAG: phosphoglucomutase/phosphomannomutase family protein [Actinomycetota bacterium]|nr:phosphoglucomutase/phosphomannomutase family protein [Actinomycetota bacterium]